MTNLELLLKEERLLAHLALAFQKEYIINLTALGQLVRKNSVCSEGQPTADVDK